MKRTSVSIILPAYNEEQGLSETIATIPQQILEKEGYDTEIIVVDNNSVDQTVTVARRLKMRVVHESQQGYGHACRRGLATSSGDIIVAADADGSHPLDRLPNLLEYFIQHKLDLLLGNRYEMGYFNNPSGEIVSRVGNACLSTLVRLLYGISLYDSQSGMWVLRRDALDCGKIRACHFDFPQELKIDLIFYGMVKWDEVPIAYMPRQSGVKKLHYFRDGLRNTVNIVRKRFKR